MTLWVRAEPFDSGAIHSPLPTKLTLHVSKACLRGHENYKTRSLSTKNLIILHRIYQHFTLKYTKFNSPTSTCTFDNILVGIPACLQNVLSCFSNVYV